jgi:hypothetical protein
MDPYILHLINCPCDETRQTGGSYSNCRCRKRLVINNIPPTPEPDPNPGPGPQPDPEPDPEPNPGPDPIPAEIVHPSDTRDDEESLEGYPRMVLPGDEDRYPVVRVPGTDEPQQQGRKFRHGSAFGDIDFLITKTKKNPKGFDNPIPDRTAVISGRPFGNIVSGLPDLPDKYELNKRDKGPEVIEFRETDGGKLINPVYIETIETPNMGEQVIEYHIVKGKNGAGGDPLLNNMTEDHKKDLDNCKKITKDAHNFVTTTNSNNCLVIAVAKGLENQAIGQADISIGARELMNDFLSPAIFPKAYMNRNFKAEGIVPEGHVARGVIEHENNYISLRGKGIYKNILRIRADYIRYSPYLNDKIFYLFTEIEANEKINRSKIKNHVASGLVMVEGIAGRHLPDPVPAGQDYGDYHRFRSDIVGKTYDALDSPHLIFRTPGRMIGDKYINYGMKNFIKYNDTCSGIYIGDGLIVTADHCIDDNDFGLPDKKGGEVTSRINYITFHRIDEATGNVVTDMTINNGPYGGDDLFVFRNNPNRAGIYEGMTDITIIDIRKYMRKNMDSSHCTVLNFPKELQKISILRDPQNMNYVSEMYAWGKMNPETPRVGRKAFPDSKGIKEHIEKVYVKGYPNELNILGFGLLNKMGEVEPKEGVHEAFGNVWELKGPSVDHVTDVSAKTTFAFCDRIPIGADRYHPGNSAASNIPLLRRGDSGGPMYYLNSKEQIVLIGPVGSLRGSSLWNCKYSDLKDSETHTELTDRNGEEYMTIGTTISPYMRWIYRMANKDVNIDPTPTSAANKAGPKFTPRHKGDACNNPPVLFIMQDYESGNVSII